MVIRIYLLLLLGLPVLAQAQAKKEHNKTAFWPGFEVKHTISEKQFVYFGHQWRYNSESGANTLAESGITSSFEEIRFTLGYEHNLSDNWRAGIAQRLAYEYNLRKWYTRVNLRHKGKLGSLAFVKRAMFEHIRPKDTSEDPEKLDPENRIRFSASLEQPFKIKEQRFSTAIEYEALFEIDPEAQKRDNKPRRVDRTRLQADVTYFLNPKIAFAFYAIKQTRYYNVLPTYNEFGEVKEPGGKLNRITPIFGIELQISTNLDEIDPLRGGRTKSNF